MKLHTIDAVHALTRMQVYTGYYTCSVIWSVHSLCSISNHVRSLYQQVQSKQQSQSYNALLHNSVSCSGAFHKGDLR